MSKSIKDIKRGMISTFPTSQAPKKEEEDKKEKKREQVPESMMKGITRESLHSHRFLYKDWVRLGEKRRKGLFKKTKYLHLFMRLEAKKHILAFYASENKNAPPAKRFRIKDCTFRVVDPKIFEIEIHANDYKSIEIKKPLKIRLKDNLAYGDFINVLKHIKLEEFTNEKALKKKGSQKTLKGKKDNAKKIKKSDVGIGMSMDEAKTFQKDVKTWTNNDVLNWSKHVIIGKNYESTLFDLSAAIIKKEKIDGKFLMALTRDEIQEIISQFGITEFKGRTLLKKEILKLQDDGKFDNVRAVVIRKVVKMLEKSGKKSSLLVTKFASNFGDPKFMIETMLNSLYMNNMDSIGKPTVFRVKLIIVENLREDRLKRLRKLLGGLIALQDALGDNKNTKYGLFHAAVSIGPLQLEWVDTSLVIVRPVSSEKVLLCVDAANIEIENGKEFCADLCQFILKWNREYEYEALNLKKSRKYANCQEFTIELLKHLNLEYRFSKHINYYLEKRLKLKGTCKMVFDFDKKFSKKFNLKNLKKNSFKPKTHRELDNFVNGLFQICPAFKSEYLSEYSLLKGFDRAFWMKNMKYNGAKVDFRPAKRIKNIDYSGCPFCDVDDDEVKFKNDDEVKTVTIHLKKRPKNFQQLFQNVQTSDKNDSVIPPNSPLAKKPPRHFNVEKKDEKKKVEKRDEVDGFVEEELGKDFDENEVLENLESHLDDEF